MTSSPKMERIDILRVELKTLIMEHRDLDAAIVALDSASGTDPLTARRLKKQKLAIKDQITRIKDELTPDIIA